MTALQTLSALDLRDRVSRYPNVPPDAITARRFNDRSANALTAAIVRWLELNGCYATRINTTGRQLPTTTIVDVLGRAHVSPGKWIPGTTRKGTADIHAVINGRHVSIEVKIGKDRMSEDQHKTKAAIESCGGVYYIAKDFASFVDWWRTDSGSHIL